MKNLKRMLRKVRVPAGTQVYKYGSGPLKEYYETKKEGIYQCDVLPTPHDKAVSVCLLIDGETYYIEDCDIFPNGLIVQYKSSCLWEEVS